jgi:hypothetical protein
MNASIWSDMLYLTLPVVEKVVRPSTKEWDLPERFTWAPVACRDPLRSGRAQGASESTVWFSPTGRSDGHRDCWRE